MSLGSFFKKLFGIPDAQSSRELLKQMEAEGVLTGAEHIDIGEGGTVRTIDEDTPDYYGSWDPHDLPEFNRRMEEINAAEQQGPAALKAVLAKYGCSSHEEYSRIQDTFLKHGFLKGEDAQNQFIQAQMNQAMAAQKQQLANALTPEMISPIDGVSLETYATIMAGRSGLKTPQEGVALLAEYGIDEAKFNAVDQQWQARMRQSDSDASMALMSEYGKYFAAAGQGQFGATGSAVADGVGVAGVAGQAPSTDAEPCSFDRYCEIMSAQNVWSEQGQDVNAMLGQVFGITAADWGNIGAYWSLKMAADFTLAQKMIPLQVKYEAQYRAGGSPDDDLNF